MATNQRWRMDQTTAHGGASGGRRRQYDQQPLVKTEGSDRKWQRLGYSDVGYKSLFPTAS
ncbi:unnamed protein product [Rhodiola kirilowii]